MKSYRKVRSKKNKTKNKSRPNRMKHCMCAKCRGDATCTMLKEGKQKITMYNCPTCGKYTV